MHALQTPQFPTKLSPDPRGLLPSPSETLAPLTRIVPLTDGRALLMLPGGECGGIGCSPEILKPAARKVEEVLR